jgi:hypothetical protein
MTYIRNAQQVIPNGNTKTNPFLSDSGPGMPLTHNIFNED